MFRFLIYISLTLFAFTSKAQKLVHLHEGKELTVPLMGYNAHMTNAPDWSDKIFSDAVKNLNPKTLRYPGGSNSFYWDWKTGWTKSYKEFFPYLEQSNFIYNQTKIKSADDLQKITIKNRKSNSFWRQLYRYNNKKLRPETISNFKKGLDNCEAEAIFTLNLISSNIDYELEMLKNASKKGINIQYIELGNELNTNNLLCKHFYPTAQSYADTCIKWAEKIWANFPEAHIGIVGGNKTKHTNNWNETLITVFQKKYPKRKEQLHFILHYYSYFYRPNFDYQTKTGAQQLLGYSHFDLKRQLTWLHWKVTKNYSTWITEYNIIEESPSEINNLWIHGLYISNEIYGFLSMTDASLLNYHNIGADTYPVFAALDLMNKDERYLQPTATGIVTSLWNRLTANAEHFHNIELDNELWEIYYPSKLSCDCPNNPRLPTTIEFNPIHAYKSSKGKKQKLLLTNTSEKPIQIELSEIGMNNAYMEQYSGSLTHDVRGELNQGEDWKVIKKTVNNKIEIPPYSITLIEE